MGSMLQHVAPLFIYVCLQAVCMIIELVIDIKFFRLKVYAKAVLVS